MKFTMNTEDFNEMINNVLPAVASLNLEVDNQFGNIYINCDGHQVKAHASSELLYIHSPLFEIEEGEPVQICVSASWLVPISKKLPGKMVSIELKDHEGHDSKDVIVKSGRYRTSSEAGTYIDDSLNVESDRFTCKIPAIDLYKGISYCMLTAAKDDVRRYLNGIDFTVLENSMTTVATNGHILSFYKAELMNKQNDETFEVIIPTKSAFEISKVLAKKEDEVTIHGNFNSLTFDLGNGYLVRTQLIPEKYPNWKKAWQEEDDDVMSDLHCNANVLHDAIDRVSAVEKNSMSASIQLKYNPEDQNIHLEIPPAYTTGRKQSNDIVPIDELNLSDKPEISCLYRPAYLMVMLKATKATNVSLHYRSDRQPLAMLFKEEPGLEVWVMPMRR